MCSYDRRSIPYIPAELIIALTRKYKKFKWSETGGIQLPQGQFDCFPPLSYPDIYKPYVLYTDARYSCVGACLAKECEEEYEAMLGKRNEKPITQTRWTTI